MQLTEKFTDWIADAFPRAKGSTGTKGNWIYIAHAELANAMPKHVAAPLRYQAGVKNGVFVNRDKEGIEFLKMPFLSDIAYMLASDMLLRVDNAKSCVEAAWREMGEHGLSSWLERAWYSIPIAFSLLSADMPNSHTPLMALMTGFSAAVAFAKMHMATLSGRGVPFTWGPNGLYYFLDNVDVSHKDFGSLDILSVLCVAQRCNSFSYYSMVGGIEAKDTNFPGVIMPSKGVFLDAWGPGWLTWQLLDTASRHGSGMSKNTTEALKKTEIIFPLSYEVSESTAYHFMAAMPKIKESSFEMREEILKSQRYALWPGVTDVEWKEAGLEGLSLLPVKNGHIFALLRGTANLSQVCEGWPEAADACFFTDVPPFRDDAEWADVQNVTKTEGPAGIFDELAIPMTAIRMCCVPVEQKARGGRAPSGYVQTPRTAKGTEKKIAVTYVPRIVRPMSDAAPRHDGKRNVGVVGRHPRLHQVAGHIRQLAMEQSASNEARTNAADAGFDLPLNGFTYVRPHTRGIGEEEIPTRQVKIRRDNTD